MLDFSKAVGERWGEFGPWSEEVCGVEGTDCQGITRHTSSFPYPFLRGELGKSGEKLLIFPFSLSLRGNVNKMKKTIFTVIYLDGQTSCLGKVLGV